MTESKLHILQQSIIRGKYYPHIDGLRAFAVLAVLLYHAFPCLCPGGFLGVDVFFVISGYLITKGLQIDIEKGEYSIGSFYARRIRRIFPAYAAVILFALLGGVLCFYGEKLNILAETACSSALFATNIYFANTSGYFSPGAHNNALLNLWSLSVEEQFYVFFPLFLAALHKWKPRYLIHYVWFVTVASFAMSVCAVNFNHYATAAFYWLPFRAWELLAGCLLALHIRDRFIETKWAMAGLCVLLFCYWGISDAMPFPGAVAFIPVCCAVIILMSGHSKSVCCIMEHPVVVYIGKISYSLYLFHWPLIVFCRYVFYGYLSPLCVNLVAIGLSFGVGILSWKYIEMPLRRANWSNGRLLKLGGIIICGALVFAYIVRHLATFEKKHVSVKVENYWDGVMISTEKYPDPMWEECENRTPGSLVLLGKEDTPPRYVLWGDSHAMALSPGFNAFSCKTGINGIYINRKHTLLEGTNTSLYPHNAQWIEDVLLWLHEHPELKNIVLVNRWAVRSQGVANESGQKVVYERQDGRGADASEVFELGIRQLCRRLKGMGKNVIIVSSIPEQILDVPEMLQRFGLFRMDNERVGITLQEYNERQAEATETFLKLEKEDLAQIEWVSPIFFDEGKSLPLLMPGRVSMYCDDDHLSPAGAKWLLESIGPRLFNRFD